MKKFWIFTLSILIAVVCFFACAGCMVSAEDKAAFEVPDSGPPVPLKTKAQPKTSVRPQTIREGQWEVGTDVKPGKYKTKGAQDSVITLCIWTVKKGENYVDSGTVNETDAQGLVTLKTGQTFETNGCQEWYLVK